MSELHVLRNWIIMFKVESFQSHALCMWDHCDNHLGTYCFLTAYYSQVGMQAHRAHGDNVKTDPLQIQQDFIGHRPTIRLSFMFTKLNHHVKSVIISIPCAMPARSLRRILQYFLFPCNILFPGWHAGASRTQWQAWICIQTHHVSENVACWNSNNSHS